MRESVGEEMMKPGQLSWMNSGLSKQTMVMLIKLEGGRWSLGRHLGRLLAFIARTSFIRMAALFLKKLTESGKISKMLRQ